MPGSARGRDGRGTPPEPAKVAVGPEGLGPDERDILCMFWTAEALPGRQLRGAPAVTMDRHELARGWMHLRHGASRYAWADEATREAVDQLARGLVATGYLSGPGPQARRAAWDAPRYGLSGAGRRALVAAVPEWWAGEGVLCAGPAVQALPAVAPAEAVATFARILAVASGLPLGAGGRPTAASQRELLRCLPPAAPVWPGDSGGGPPGRGRARPAEAAEALPEQAEEDAGPAAWAGFAPRLGVWLAAAAYEGLLLRDGAAGARGAWAVPDVDAWLDLPAEQQWARLVRAWARAAAASALGGILVSQLDARGPGGAWLAPDPLLAWLNRYRAGAADMGPHLRDAVVRAGADLGVLALGTVRAGAVPGGGTLACALTEAGRHALHGQAPAPWPTPDPATVASDFTVVQPVGADPLAAFCLRRVAELQGVDRVATYRLTRAAWAAARARGEDPLELWESAIEDSRHPVPQNIAFTLQSDWSDASRLASLETALLLRFPAEEAAAAARRDATLRQALREELTPTVWLLEPGREAPVRRALQKLGIAAGAAAEVAATAAPRTRARAPADGGAAASADLAEFRMPWPGPFGDPDHNGGPEGLLGASVPVPPALVRMPAQALYRRLWLASKNGEEVWVDLVEEGVVRFLPEQVTRRTVSGQCRGCGRHHALDLEEVRALLDQQAGDR